MKDKILLTFALSELAFVATGVLLVVFSLTTKANMKDAFTLSNVVDNLLLAQTPLSAATINAIVIFVTFVASIPAMIMPTTKGWLVMHGYMIVGCALFTMVLGLDIWFKTLKTRENLAVVWNQQTSTTQSLLQQSLSCCGYANSTSPPFVVDSTCPIAFAATMVGCITPFSSKANIFLDFIFTGAFGIVGIDVVLILATAMLLKDRQEKERYRHIDEKNGTQGF